MMLEHIAHLPFIAGSYAAAGAVIGALIAWVTLDFRRQRRALTELEMRGVTRRAASALADRTLTEAGEQA
jgi:heme exporter protein D